jgi:hypothetical protein
MMAKPYLLMFGLRQEIVNLTSLFLSFIFFFFLSYLSNLVHDVSTNCPKIRLVMTVIANGSGIP